MKSKYMGVTALVIAAVSVLVAILIFTLVNFHPAVFFGDRSAQTRTLTPAEQRSQQAIEHYTAQLDTLFAPANVVSTDFERMFPAARVATPSEPTFRRRELSMIYRAPGDAYALIDERLYREGDSLPGNASLVSIESASVWLIENNQRRQLRLEGSRAGLPASIVSRSYAIAE